MIRTLDRTFVIATAVVAAASLAACGSSSSSSSSSSGSAASSPATQSASSSSSASPTSSSATSGSQTASTTAAGHIDVTLTGQNHAPVATKPWIYTVTARTSTGRPLSGTVRIQFVFGTSVVGTDKPPVHPIRNGRWRDYLEFPQEAVGHPLTLQAVVHTPQGSATRNWPVTVRP